MTDITGQFINLFWMIIFGFFAAGFWNLGQRLARKWLKDKIKLAVADFVFCLFTALSFWRMLLWVNGGVLRNYVLLGCLIGMFLYSKFFHR